LTRRPKYTHWISTNGIILIEMLKVGKASDSEGIPDGWLGLDAGEKSRELFRNTVLEAKTILWNGQVFMFPACPLTR
jgi:hypothetical protein